MDMDNRVGIDCGSREWAGQGEQWGKIGTTVIEQQYKNTKKERNYFIISKFLNLCA